MDSPSINKSAQSQCELKMLLPNGKFLFCWNIIVLVLMLYALFYIGAYIGYTSLAGTLEPVSLFETLLLVSDCAVLIDIVFNFRTAYIDPSDPSRVIAISKSIAKKYLRSWFLIDFLASGVLGMVFTFFVEESRMMRVLRLLTLFKALKAWRSALIVKRYKCESPPYTIVTEETHQEMEAV